jgi:hypothetical protein
MVAPWTPLGYGLRYLIQRDPVDGQGRDHSFEYWYDGLE